MISHSQYQTMMVSDTVSSGKKRKILISSQNLNLGLVNARSDALT